MLVNGIAGPGWEGSLGAPRAAAVPATEPAAQPATTQPVAGTTAQPLSSAMLGELLGQQFLSYGSYL